MSEARTPTAVDAIADRYLDDSAAHDPITATHIGLAGHDEALPALDPDWFQQRAELRARTRRALQAAEPVDANDRVTIAALDDTLEIHEHLRDLGEEESHLNNIDSPVQTLRDV